MPMLDSRPAERYDVVVIGSGLAGIASALAAHEGGARTLVVEKAPPESAGGSTRFSGGGFRVPRDGYTPDDFFEDLMMVTKGQGNKQLLRKMADRAHEDVAWLQGHGLTFGDTSKFRPDLDARRVQVFMAEPEPFDIEGATQIGSGNGVVRQLHPPMLERVDMVCETKAERLLVDEHRRITGVRVFSREHGYLDIEAGAVVIASGGFQANDEMRSRYFGRDAVHWRIRGTRFNVGDGLRLATEIGAAPVGEFADIHCAVIDARSRAVECGETNVNTYPFGIIVNNAGQRFIDEGEDFRDRTYAKFGKSILAQPDSVAHLIFDEKLVDLIAGLIEQWGPVSAPTLPGLAEQLGIDAEGLERTVANFNDAVDKSVEFSSKAKDGRSARGIVPEKSNWAMEVDTPPYYGISLTGGITFTFGGLKTSLESEVIDAEGYPIPGLYAAGEIQGDFFYYNYPSGSSLVRATVYGRTAGTNAAAKAAEASTAAR